MRWRLSIVLAGVTGLAVALSVAVPAAQAAPAPGASTATVAERLIFEPTDRGYRGTLQAEVTYQGSEPGRATYVITEPVPGSYQNLEWGVSCYSGGEWLPDRRTVVECDVPGGELAPGERRAFTVDFRVLTTIQPYAMKAEDGQLAVKVNGEVVTDERFKTRFRSSTGSLDEPQLYVQDQQPNASITVTGKLTLVRRPDGTFEGRLPVTVRYNGDAPHDSIWVVPQSMPAGLWDPWTEECSHYCVPGGAFMEGEERTFEFIFGASADTPIGDLGEMTLEVQPLMLRWPYPDVDPSDNVTAFSVTTTEAA